MSVDEARGKLERRIEETQMIYVKGKRRDDPTRQWAEARIEGMKEGLWLIRLIEEGGK